MQPGAEGFDGGVVPGWMDAVGQQDNRQRPVDVQPEGSPGEAEMADTVMGKIMPGT